jgi:hypothetical protein
MLDVDVTTTLEEQRERWKEGGTVQKREVNWGQRECSFKRGDQDGEK